MGLVVKGEDYLERGLAHYTEQVTKTKDAALRRLAAELGQELVPMPKTRI